MGIRTASRALRALGLILLALGMRAGEPPIAAKPVRALAHYVHQEWHAADGLPQETVESLARGTDGYLWAGTQDGLVRYDGRRFDLFHPRTHPDFGSRHVQSLAAGPEGVLWIGTARGVYRFAKGRIQPAGFPDAAVRRVLLARNGALWVGTTQGLGVLEDGRERRLLPPSGESLEIIALAEGPTGEILVGSDHGVFRVEGASLAPHPAPPMRSQWRAIRFSRDGALWFGGQGGLWRYRDGQFAPLELRPEEPGGVSDFWEDVHGNLWVATKRGLLRMLAGRFPKIEAESLPIRPGVSWAEDHEGGLWIGTWGRGLHRLSSGRAMVLGTREGLAGDYALALRETKDGAIWLGSSEGLTRLKDGRFRTWRVKDGLPGPSVHALYEDEENRLWIGTDGGLCRMEGDRIRSENWRVGRANVFSIDGDGGRGLWVGTWAGLDHIPDKNSSTPGFEPFLGHPRTLTWMVYRTRDGSVWVAGESPGLTRISGMNAERFLPPQVPRDTILAAYEDPDGVMWFGTAGSGLLRYRDGRFVAVGGGGALPDDVIYAIVPDEEDGLWLSSNHGIFRVGRAALAAAADGRPGPLVLDSVGIPDGMLSHECNGTMTASGIRSRDGRFWFPTTQGVAVLDARQITVAQSKVPVVIKEVLADQRPLLLEKEIAAPSGRGELEFRFTGISFVARESMRLRYKLEGFEAGWREVGQEHAARYTNLPPGRYEFRLISETQGPTRMPVIQEVSVRIVLKPHWYQMLWVRLLALGTVLAGFGLAIRAKLRKLRMRHRELKREAKQALEQVDLLKGLLPICAWCSQVRTDQGYWERLEDYVTQHGGPQFTHGICPTCAEDMKRKAQSRPSVEKSEQA